PALLRRNGPAVALADGVEHHEIAHRRRDAQAAGDGGSVGEHLREALAALEGPHDLRAAVALATDEPRHLLRPQPAELAQLLKRFPHADEAVAAARWIENHVRQLPAELFGQFESHRLLAFEAIRLLERGEVEPAHVRRAFADD